MVIGWINIFIRSCLNYLYFISFRVILNKYIIGVTCVIALALGTPQGTSYLINIAVYLIELLSLSVVVSIQVIRLLKYLINYHQNEIQRILIYIYQRILILINNIIIYIPHGINILRYILIYYILYYCRRIKDYINIHLVSLVKRVLRIVRGLFIEFIVGIYRAVSTIVVGILSLPGFIFENKFLLYLFIAFSVNIILIAVALHFKENNDRIN